MKDKLILPRNPTLNDFQKYMRDMIKLRGFEKETWSQRFVLLMEECGELAKAARKTKEMKVDSKSKHHDLEEETADVFMLLLEIVNDFNIDLEKAFKKKEEINKKRVWK